MAIPRTRETPDRKETSRPIGAVRPASLLHSLERWPAARVLLGTLSALVAIGFADFLTPAQVGLAVFNVVPVFVAAMRFGRRAAYPFAGLSAFSWFASEVFHRHANGLPTLLGWDLASRLIFFGVIAELSCQLREALEMARYEGRTDPLTGLLNRRAFFERAESAVRRSREFSEQLAVAFIDVDDFKMVNDTLGHETGDSVLRTLGHALGCSARSGDVVARLGGDEFAILLPSTGLAEVRSVGSKLEALLAEALASTGVWSGASIGIAVLSDQTPSVDALLRAADADMFHSKRARKGSAGPGGSASSASGLPRRRRADP
jgi:diguanylate cyclase (GGDEF)-like protein